MDWRLYLRNATLHLAAGALVGAGGLAVGLPFLSGHPHFALLLSVVAMGFFMVFLYEPIRRAIQPAIDTLLFAGRFSYMEALGQLPNDLLEFTNLREMLGFLVTRLTEAAKLERVRVFMYDSGHQAYVEMLFRGSSRSDRGSVPHAVELPDGSALVRCLREEGRLVTLADLDRLSGSETPAGSAELRNLEGAACFPINKENELLGFVVLGRKRSGDPFHTQDLRILRVLRRRLENFLTQAMILTQEALNMVKDSHSMKNEVNTLKGRTSWRAMLLASWRTEFEKEVERLEKWLAITRSQIPAAETEMLTATLAAIRERSAAFLAETQRSLPIEENAIARLSHHLKNWAEFGRVVAEGFRGRRPLEVVDVGQTARLSVDRWKPMAEKKNVSLSVDVQGSLFIWGERSLLEQIIENLIDNAVKATQQGFVQVICRQEQNEIHIEVRDSGCGIPAPDVNTIFDKPFYQRLGQEKLEQSTGVGLYLVAQYARSMGGRVAAASDLGKGSTFHVILPAYSKQSKQAEVAA